MLYFIRVSVELEILCVLYFITVQFVTVDYTTVASAVPYRVYGAVQYSRTLCSVCTAAEYTVQQYSSTL